MGKLLSRAIISSMLFILSMISCSASTIGVLRTSVSGGVAGFEESFQPLIQFKGAPALFSEHYITEFDEGLEFSLTLEQNTLAFEQFVENLTDEKDDLLKVGHKVGQVKSDLASFESSWFSNWYLLKKQKIAKITLVCTNINFETVMNGNYAWTNFTFDLALKIEGISEYPINLALIDFNQQEKKVNDRFEMKGEQEHRIRTGNNHSIVTQRERFNGLLSREKIRETSLIFLLGLISSTLK